ncbi:MAG: RNA-binding protein [Chitinophagales bacterium]|nr:RNA-binding protein [Chitinophagales bacterium]
MKIFAGGLPFSLDETTLKETFEAYGQVSSAKIINDKLSGKSRGFAFIEMADDAEAKKAIDGLNNSQMEGRTIAVKVAEDRREGGSSRGGDSWGNSR